MGHSMRPMQIVSLGFVLAPMTATAAVAQPVCPFDARRLSFAGTAIEQARCLLSPVLIRGGIGTRPARLGPTLERLVGSEVRLDREALRRKLLEAGLSQMADTLGQPVSRTQSGVPALYYVIHDTSQKYPGTQFPDNADPGLNRLGFKKRGEYVAHVFINRLGNVLVGHDIAVPWRATQLELRTGVSTRGRFIHVEHNQPRLRDPANSRENDNLAPRPGLTDAQYDRSALTYIWASARAGRWLIPAFHAVLDKGFGTHDDPQNFDLAAFNAAVGRHVSPMLQSSGGPSR